LRIGTVYSSLSAKLKLISRYIYTGTQMKQMFVPDLSRHIFDPGQFLYRPQDQITREKISV